ncbi:MAG: flagellar hook-basal body complex protein FliE [Pseudomonadota bacterium]
MDIQQSFAARLYDSARQLGDPSAAPGAEERAEGPSFAETLARAAQEITQTIQRGEETATQAVSAPDGDVQSVVEALTATEMALQTAVAVRDRVVEAYQDVLRMPV